MPYANTLKIFETLRPKFDEEKAKVIAEAIEGALETNNDALLEKLDERLNKFATKTDLAEVKAELIKWMFIFMVGQFFSIVGVLTLLLRK